MTEKSIKLPLEEYFRYHPPTTEERKARHDAINQAALSFAKIIEANVEDEELYKKAIFAVWEAKALANQGVTLDELRKEQEKKELK